MTHTRTERLRARSRPRPFRAVLAACLLLGLAALPATGAVTVPSAPLSLLAGNETGGAFGLTWQEPATPGGGGALSYHVEVQLKLANAWAEPAAANVWVDNTERMATVGGLDMVTDYQARVRASNTAGYGPYSGVVNVSTGVHSTPGAVGNLRLVSVGGDTFKVEWDVPVDTGGSALQSYKVEVNTPALNTSTVAPPSLTSATRYNLNVTTAYTVRVAAQNLLAGCDGPGVWSELLVTTLAPQVPGPVTSLALSSATGSKLTVSWALPLVLGGSPVTGYRGAYRETGGGGSAPWYNFTTQGSGNTTWVQASLSASTSYDVRVSAFNAIGNGTETTITASTAAATAPVTAPVYVTVSSVTGSTATVTYAQPKDNGGSPVTGYELWGALQGGTLVLDTTCGLSLSCTATGKANDTAYDFAVRAINAVGSSPSSAVVTATTGPRTAPVTAPAAPTLDAPATGCGYAGIDVVACNPSAGAFTVTPSLPSDLGGSLSGDPSIAARIFVDGTLVYTGDVQSVYVPGVPSNTALNVVVSVGNSEGYGPNSTALVVTTVATGHAVGMAAPHSISATGGQLCFGWGQPQDRGGPGSITAIRLYKSAPNVGRSVCADAGDNRCELLETLGAGVTSYCHNGLSPSALYTYRVGADNSAGAGYLSDLGSFVTTAATVPGEVAKPVVTSVASTTIVLSWTVPVDMGGAGFTQYDVKYYSSSDPTPVTVVVGTTSKTLSGLDPLTNYTIAVRCANTVGNGPYSAVVHTTTAAGVAGHASFVVASSPLTVGESDGNFTVDLTRLVGDFGTLPVNISSPATCSGAGGGACATPGVDYVLPNQTVSFLQGTSSAYFNVSLVNDTVFEFPVEEFDITVHSPDGYSETLTVRIRDDDSGTFGWQDSAVDVVENAGLATLTLTRTGGVSGAVTVNVDAYPGTALAPGDFTKPVVPVAVNFADGQTSATVAITLINDATFEFTELWFLASIVSVSPYVVPIDGGLDVNMTVTITDDGDEGVAAAPPSPTLFLATGGRLQLSTSEPANKGGTAVTISAVEVYRVMPDTSLSLKCSAAAGSDACTVSGLTASTSYTFVTKAVNTHGTSAASTQAVFTTTAPSTPTPPLGLGLAAATGGSLSLTWSAPSDTGGQPMSAYQVKLSENVGGPFNLVYDGATAATTYTHYDGLVASTTYYVTVRGKNPSSAYSSFSPVVSVTTGAPSLPSQPASVVQGAATGGQVAIDVDAPLDTGGVALVAYHVQLRESGMAAWSKATTQVSGTLSQTGTTTLLIGKLVASTTYDVRIAALNTAGNGTAGATATIASGATSVTTDADVRSVLLTGDQVLLGGVAYTVHSMGSATATSFPITTSYAGASTATMDVLQRVSPLLPGTIVTTSRTVPGVASRPAVLAATAGAALVRLEPPLDTGGTAIIGYEVYVRNATSTEFTKVDLTLTGETVDEWVPGFVPNATYEIKASALNVISVCNEDRILGPAASVTTLAVYTAPSAPRDLIVVDSTGGAATLTWLLPKDFGGVLLESLTHQLEVRAPTGTGDWEFAANTTASTVRTTVYGLSATGYGYSIIDFRVRTVTPFLPSSWTAPVTYSMPSATPPSAPRNVVTSNVTGGSVIVRWSPPLDYGGRPLVSYRVRVVRTGDGSSFTLSVPAPGDDGDATVLVGDLVALSQYSVAIEAFTGSVYGTPSASVALTTLAASPPSRLAAPTQIGATGGSVTFTWVAPADKGGAALTGFRIYKGGVLADTISNPGATAATLYGLTYVVGGTNVAVAAVNTANMSGVIGHATAMFVSAPTPPTAPRTLYLSSSGGAVYAAWNYPLDRGGLAISKYEVYLKTSSAPIANYTRVYKGTLRDVTLGGLYPSTSYDVYVLAFNSAGSSPATAVKSVSTLAAARPRGPVNIGIVAVSESSIQLSWDPPLDDGGVPVLSYTTREIQISSPYPTWVQHSGTLAANATSRVISGLLQARTYWFAVAASNVVGLGSWSTEAVYITNPPNGAPRDLLASSVASTRAVIAWVVPSPVFGIDYTGYRVYSNDTGTWVLLATLSASTFEYEAVGLNVGTVYHLAVDSMNTTSARRLAVDDMFTHSATATPLFNDAATAAADEEADRAVAELHRQRRLASANLPSSSSSVVSFTTAQDDSVLSFSGWSGTIISGAYAANTTATFVISVPSAARRMTLEVSHFDLECDYDYLRVYLADETEIWRGGCQRSKPFVLSVDARTVSMQLVSDLTVQRSGFQLNFTAHADVLLDAAPVATDDACPGTPLPCSGPDHGVCSSDGTCVCSPQYTGEDCSAGVLCPGPALCSSLDRVVLLDAVYGSDVDGTGFVGTPLAQGSGGKVGKPVASLAQAVAAAANVTSGTPVIVLAPGTHPAASMCGATLAGTGVTIMGMPRFGVDETVIDCEGVDRFVTIGSDNVTMDGFSIVNGAAASGAGVLVSASGSATLRNMQVTSCTASGDGGGIRVEAGGTLVLEAGAVANNTAGGDGGGVSVASAGQLVARKSAANVRTSVRDNVAANAGGGVACDGCVLDGAAATTAAHRFLRLDNNTAALGGNLAVLGSSAAVSRVAAWDCATSTSLGGGVYVSGIGHTLTSVRARGNHATRGGGMYLAASAAVSLHDVTLDANTARLGAGMFLAENATCSAQGAASESRVTGNTAAEAGGGASVAAGAQASGLLVQSNQAPTGAGVYVPSPGAHGRAAAVIGPRCLVRRNVATALGGGVAVAAGAHVVINATIDANVAADGGGLALLDGSLAESDAGVATFTMAGNNATGSGGCIYMQNAELRSAEVHGCDARVGGGIATNGTSLVRTAWVHDNVVTGHGGGVAVGPAGSLDCRSCSVFRNAAATAGATGGGVSLARGAQVAFSAAPASPAVSLLVANNTASASGGGVWCSNCAGIVPRSGSSAPPAEVYGNVALSVGGGGFAATPDAAEPLLGAPAVLERVRVRDNTVSSGNGGGVWAVGGGSVRLKLTVVSSNTATGCGGGVALSSCTLEHDGARLESNSAAQGGLLCLLSSSVVPAPASSSTLTLLDGVATSTGGCVHVSGTSTLKAWVASDCLATGNGGGVYVVGPGTATLEAGVVANSTTAGSGGGLAASSATVDLRGLVVEANYAPVSGGGISLVSSTVTAAAAPLGTTVQRNSAPTGAGLRLQASTWTGGVTVRHHVTTGDGACVMFGTGTSSVSLLVATNCTAQRGGAVVAVAGASATLPGATITGCESLGDGGAGYVAASGSLTLQASSTCRGNSAGGSGGCLAGTGALVVRDSVLAANFATSGGGAVSITFPTATALLADSMIANNTIATGAYGGGVRAAFEAVVTMQDCVLRGNIAKVGGGLFVQRAVANVYRSVFGTPGTPLLPSAATAASAAGITHGAAVGVEELSFTNEPVFLQDCTLVNLAAEAGPALHLVRARVVMERTTVEGNRAAANGGAIIAADAVLETRDCVMRDNHAWFDGGVALLTKSLLNATGGSMTGNSGQHGGAVFLELGSTLEARDVIMDDNHVEASGGAVMADRGTFMRLWGCNVTSNVAGQDGGGLFVSDASLTVDGGWVYDNSAVSGGGISVTQAGVVTMTNALMIANRATTAGGAVTVNAFGKWHCIGCLVAANYAPVGGAVYLFGSVDASDENRQAEVLVRGRPGGGPAPWPLCFRDNTATSGGVIYMPASAQGLATIEFCHVTENVAEKTGGVIVVQGPVEVTLAYTRFSYNRVTDPVVGRGGVLAVLAEPKNLTALYLDFDSNYALAGASVYWVVPNESPSRRLALDLYRSERRLTTSGSGFHCSGCTLGPTPAGTSHYASTPVGVRMASVREFNVQSGVPLGFNGIPAPEIHTLDWYGQAVATDMTTSCSLNDPGQGVEILGSVVSVAANGLQSELAAGRGGKVSFEGLIVRGNSGQVVTLTFACDVDGVPLDLSQSLLSVNVTIEDCHAGKVLNSARSCVACPSGTYSYDGTACLPCPTGGNCSYSVGLDEIAVGLQYPESVAGFYLYHVQKSKRTGLCDTLRSRRSNCTAAEVAVADGSCVASTAEADDLYACGTYMQLYVCRIDGACTGGVRNVSSSLRHVGCSDGSVGLMCAKCVPGYTRSAGGSCEPCAATSDFGTVVHAATLVLIALIILVAMVLQQGGQLAELVCCNELRLRYRRHKRAKARAEGKGDGGTEEADEEDVAAVKVYLRDDKVKMLLSFLQIIAGFLTSYILQWPTDVVSYMRVLSAVNFNILKIGSLDCLIETSLYLDFMTTFAFPFIFGLFLAVTYCMRACVIRRKLRVTHFQKCYGGVLDKQKDQPGGNARRLRSVQNLQQLLWQSRPDVLAGANLGRNASRHAKSRRRMGGGSRAAPAGAGRQPVPGREPRDQERVERVQAVDGETGDEMGKRRRAKQPASRGDDDESMAAIPGAIQLQDHTDSDGSSGSEEDTSNAWDKWLAGVEMKRRETEVRLATVVRDAMGNNDGGDASKSKQGFADVGAGDATPKGGSRKKRRGAAGDDEAKESKHAPALAEGDVRQVVDAVHRRRGRRSSIQHVEQLTRIAARDVDVTADQGAEFEEPRGDALKPRDVYPVEIWEMYSKANEWSSLAQEQLCLCVNRDPDLTQDEVAKLCPRGQLQQKLTQLYNRTVQLFLFVLLFAYAPMSAKTLSIWHCIEMGDAWYLSEDLNEPCYEGRWFYFAMWSLIAVVLFVLGIPYLFVSLVRDQRRRHVDVYMQQLYGKGFTRAEQLRNKGTCSARLLYCWYRRIRPVVFSFDSMLTSIFTVDKEKKLDLRALYRADQQPEVLEGVLRKERRNLRLAARKDLTDRNTIIRGTTSNMVRQFLYRDNLDSSHAKDRVGFLYSAYKFQYWWYDVVNLSRKLVLNGLVIFITQSRGQLLFGIAASFVGVCVHQILAPYRRFSDNLIQNVLNMQLFISLFCGLVLALNKVAAEATGAGEREELVTVITGRFMLVTNIISVAAALLIIVRETQLDAKEEAARRKRRVNAELAAFRQMHQLAADNLDVPTLSHTLSPIGSDDDEGEADSDGDGVPKRQRKRGKKGKK